MAQIEGKEIKEHALDNRVAMMTTDLDEYTEELNESCPMIYNDEWIIRSFTMVGDRYALVDLQAPAALSMVFNSLTEDKDNVRQVWIKQLKQYGERWNRFVNLLVMADCPLIINLCPEGKTKSALIRFQPSDFKK